MTRLGPFKKIPRAFASVIGRIGGAELRVLLWLMLERDIGDRVSIHFGRLVADTGLGDRQARRALSRLTADRLIAYASGKPLGKGKGRTPCTAIVRVEAVRPDTEDHSNDDRPDTGDQSNPVRPDTHDQIGAVTHDRSLGDRRPRIHTQASPAHRKVVGPRFIDNAGKEWRLSPGHLASLERDFPEFDLPTELEEMARYCADTPSWRRQPSGVFKAIQQRLEFLRKARTSGPIPGSAEWYDAAAAAMPIAAQVPVETTP